MFSNFVDGLLGHPYQEYQLHFFMGIKVNVRSFTSSAVCLEKNNTKFLDVVTNRNPRNLEMMGLAWKRKGWGFQYPSKDYYNKLVVSLTNRHISAYIQHKDGSIVVSCSTKEPNLLRHLHSASSQSAAYNVGRVLSLRCLQVGLHNVSHKDYLETQSKKIELLRRGLEEGGVELNETDEYDRRIDYEPGINYDNESELEELKTRQAKVYCLGSRSTVTKWLNKKRKLRHRYRPIRPPRKLEAPQAIYYS